MYVTRQQSIALAVGFLALFFALGMVLLQRSYVRPPQSATPAQPLVEQEQAADPAKFQLNEFHRVETKDGKKLWEVKAQNGRYFPETNTAKVNNGTVWIFKKNGDVVQLTAASATLHLEGASLSKAEASEGVQLVFNEKLKIETSEATYDKNAAKVFAPGHVKIVSDSMELAGEELSANVEDQSFTFARNVTSMIYSKKKTDEKNQPH